MLTAYLSPREIAERWGCRPSKVISLIESGELRAINTATRRDGKKPRWKITPEDLAALEAGRSNTATIAPPRPKRPVRPATVLRLV